MNEISFLSEGDGARITASKVPLKFSLLGNTFCAVFDDSWRENITPEEKVVFKTRVFRKNLVTGKEDVDQFMSSDRYVFKTYLSGENGSTMYRVVSTENDLKLVVYDLDKNKVLVEQVLESIKDNGAMVRKGNEHKLLTGDLHVGSKMKAYEASDIGLMVDGYNNETIITFGTIVNDIEMAAAVFGPGGLPATLIVNTYLLMKDDKNDLTYVYLKGTPESGFKPMPLVQNSTFIRLRMDEYEMKLQNQGRVDYLGYYAGKKSWVAVSSFTKSTDRIVAVFSKKQ